HAQQEGGEWSNNRHVSYTHYSNYRLKPLLCNLRTTKRTFCPLSSYRNRDANPWRRTTTRCRRIETETPTDDCTKKPVQVIQNQRRGHTGVNTKDPSPPRLGSFLRK